MKNIVDVYNDKGVFLKKVYSRYAEHQVLKGTAYWKNYSTIVIGPIKDAIMRAFPKVGDSLSVADTVETLEKHFRNCAFPKNKAYGSIGGASRHNFIEFDSSTKKWKRIR